MTATDRNKGGLLDGLETSPSAPAKASANEASWNGKTLGAIALVLASVLVLGYVAYSSYSSYLEDPRRAAFLPTLMDAETGEVFEKYSVGRGENRPYLNPKTGKRSLYPIELCYWTRDGKAKFPPTYVILNEMRGVSGPTICPDCGRRVTLYNSRPPDSLMQAAWDASQKK